MAEAMKAAPLTVRSLLEAGVHFGHQTRRWDPRMKSFIFGERDGIHIIDLDQTLPQFEEALDFLKETVAEGGKVLFVGTKRQAAAPIESEARRSGQFYVSERWLGGMLTNFRTVKKSIDRYKEMLGILEDEEKRAEITKKEAARLTRETNKYRRSLEGIRDMTKLPDAVFIIDVSAEHIAVSEARRLPWWRTVAWPAPSSSTSACWPSARQRPSAGPTPRPRRPAPAAWSSRSSSPRAGDEVRSGGRAEPARSRRCWTPPPPRSQPLRRRHRPPPRKARLRLRRRRAEPSRFRSRERQRWRRSVHSR
jgi:ribosomal protein S2